MVGRVEAPGLIWPLVSNATTPVAIWPLLRPAPVATSLAGSTCSSVNHSLAVGDFNMDMVIDRTPPWLSYTWMVRWKSGVTEPDAMLLAGSAES